MRHALLLTGLASLAACSGAASRSAPTAPPGEPEVARPAWQLLVERVTAVGRRSFVAMAPDRTFIAPLPGVPLDALRVSPSPDGRTLAVHRPSDGLVHLWLVDRDGENPRPLVAGPVTVGEASWSPDGRRLAVEVTTLDVTSDIWVVNADGSGTANLTPDPHPAIWYDRSPAWSPDGTSIAFASNRSGTTRLWVMGADGSAPRQVLPESLQAAEHLPAWSPDGGTIAFVTETAVGAGIGVVRPDGSGHRFFPAPFDATDPIWLPDGRIAFADRRTGDFEIHLLDPATGITTNLTRHADHDLRASVLRYVAPPAWRGLASPVRYAAAPASPVALAAADLDADGAVDVASLAPAAPNPGLRIFRGTGHGGLLPLGTLDASPAARQVAAGPITRDGAADLVILEGDALALHRGTTGGPGPVERTALLGPATGMVTADLDRDGLLDVALVVERPGTGFRLEVYRVDGDDRLIFNVDMPTEFTNAGRLCAGDVTGDGSADLVVLTSRVDTPVLLLAGRGDITFSPPQVSGAPRALDSDAVPLCEDLDGDGLADLAVLRPGRSSGIALLPSSGSTFGPGRSPVLPAAVDLAAGDLDRDGDVDLVVAPADRSGLLFLRNLGDGTFATPVEISLGGNPARILVSDLDGDLWPDLIVAEQDGTVAVLRNLGGAPRAGG